MVKKILIGVTLLLLVVVFACKSSNDESTPSEDVKTEQEV